MRKFRVYDEIQKRYYDTNHDYLEPFLNQNGELLFLDWKANNGCSFIPNQNNKNYIVEFSSGFIVKGKEVFQGDKVKHSCVYHGENWTLEGNVFQNDSGIWVILFKNGNEVGLWDEIYNKECCIEVIGTIHEGQ